MKPVKVPLVIAPTVFVPLYSLEAIDAAVIVNSFFATAFVNAVYVIS